jgi:hypothetical protein
MVGSAVNKPIELVMTSSTLVIQLTGQNQSCKGHRPLLTGRGSGFLKKALKTGPDWT